MKTSFKYLLSIALIAIISFSLRFEGLGLLEGAVFDEIFYPQYGFNYLQNQEFFYPHPPLANYLYALSISVYVLINSLFGVSVNITDFQNLDPMSYRWLNALIGSLLFALTYKIAFSIHNNRAFALLASLFVAIDGSMIVDSRIATANMFLLFFGLFSISIFLSYLNQIKKSPKYLLYFSLFLGLTVSIKWNGLGFFLMASSYYFLLLGLNEYDKSRNFNGAHARKYYEITEYISPLTYFLYFLFFPGILYCIIFLPDLFLNTQFNFLEKHQEMMGYHQIMVSENEHPYCSKWYSWPLMIKPIAYFFENYTLVSNGASMIRNIHLFPNPALSLFSLMSIIIMSIHWLKLFTKWIKKGFIEKKFFILSFILLGYFCNLIPWFMVNRCTFIYHYEPASIFGFLACSWYLSQWIEAKELGKKVFSWSILLIVLIAFLYWLPIQLGIPIESFQFYDRMWFLSWI